MNRKFVGKILLVPTLTVLSLTSCGSNENKVTVRWTNYDNSELLVEKYAAGDTPSYKLENPTRPSEGSITYVFSGWNPAIGPVTKDTTYTAQYNAIIQEKYTITWKNYNGDILFVEENVPAGTNPKYPGKTLPTRPMTSEAYYVFKGWSPELEPVTKNSEYTAEYYAVTSTSDCDYDGMPDCIDPEPENNVFSNVRLKCFNPVSSDLKIDYRLLTNGNNEVYNKDLARLGIYLSNRSVDFHDGMFSPEDFGGDINALYSRLGCDDIFDINMKPSDYEIDSNDTSGASLAHHVVIEGDKKTDVIFINVQSTRGSQYMEEWVSNLDIGATGGVYQEVTGEHPEWIDKTFHKGFGIAAERFLFNNKTMGAKEYVDNHCQNGNPVLFISGHSRGGGCANILGDYFANVYKTPSGSSPKVFTYTYASPRTRDISGARSVNTMFNIVNDDDLVSMLPLKQWGMDRLGPSGQVDYIVDSVNEKYLSQYIAATGHEYKYLVGIKDVLAKITSTRNELYDPAMIDINKTCSYKGFATRAEAEAKQAEVIDVLKNVLLISPKYYSFEISEESNGKYDLHAYNCAAAVSAIASNILMNKYSSSILYQYASLILTPRYLEVFLGVYNAGVSDFNTIVHPHDLSAYLVIVNNHQ